MTSITIAGVDIDTRHWIGGTRVASDSTFDTVSPVDGSVLGQISRGGKLEADAAVAAAREAFLTWSRMSPAERGEILLRLADSIDEHVEELAQIETLDNGSLLRSHRRGVMPRVAMNIRFFADYAMNRLSHPEFETRGHTNHVSWDPSGVAVIITPWNAPLMLATWRIGPALASGDTVVLKPPEWAPLTASYFADLAHRAGLPAGVFNVVQGFGAEAGAPLTSNPDVSRICFTGSVPTAKVIAHAAADNLTPCSFELGGKSPTVILDDADLDLAVDLAIEQYDNAGQVCLAGTRLLVQRGVADAFIERFRERAGQITQGDPRNEETQIGPNIHLTHIERVQAFVDRAVSDGATLAYGGEVNTELGSHYFRPTLIVDAPQGSEILTQEVFGPVLTMQVFDTDEEGLDLANGTEFGLAACVVSGSRMRAEDFCRFLVAGTIWVNCFFVRDLSAPFGGSKKSGIGREGGLWSFDFYADVKNTVYAPNGWKG
ncbi:MAG: aldehyde dehydrogenase family protein [Candidatus Nanopelagicales bacterium]|nr:aldehyde dehydrogenase family protein [Candidatus Nanopelagicales bacterium]MCF8536476.1 aldehyde dehydrogenase family protein [Candidatus Nanopelagicales bacterium]MCF8541596.1 aldehyde dehydrogenase family protein [Candidatus Nanopelagicales bacterium]MCF8556610.1 aldehyde dehydrogenase family protein [Candidatus Nanopelagicales bacterium]